MVEHGIEVEELIQVTESISEEEVCRKKINGLLDASEVTGCRNLLIITWEEQEDIKLDNEIRVRVVPAWRWLLGK